MGDIVLLLSSRKRVLSVDRFMILHLKWLLPSKFFIRKHNVHAMMFKYSIKPLIYLLLCTARTLLGILHNGHVLFYAFDYLLII